MILKAIGTVIILHIPIISYFALFGKISNASVIMNMLYVGTLALGSSVYIESRNNESE